MSHITRIKTVMVEKDYLKAALQDLGYTVEEGALKVGMLGERTPVEMKISTGFLSCAIGLRRSGDAYEVVADWSGIRGIKRKDFLQKIQQRYAYHAARARLTEQGFELTSEEVQKDGKIHLVLRRMA